MTAKSAENPALLPYRIDKADNLFAAMRRQRGYRYVDALEAPSACGDEVPALFWPGCTLSCYSQELTMAVFDYLRQRGLADGMSVKCCSNILRFASGAETRMAFARELALELQEHGVRRLVVACPNCYNSFCELAEAGILGQLEVLALSAVLLQQGEHVSPEQVLSHLARRPAQSAGSNSHAPNGNVPVAPVTAPPSVCVHDSCPDRRHGVFAESVRGLFPGCELREMEHHHDHALCCGIGRLLFIRNPGQSSKQRGQRQEEFLRTGAELLVTSCVSCANAFQNLPDSCHYLELLFGVRIDWPAAISAAEQALKACGDSRAIKEA